MDVKFTNSVCSSLKPVLWEVSSSEQTQEIKLSDGFPDVGRVISAWGQCILRSKEWNLTHIQCSAGMMVWILYAPEDESEPRMLNTWIPFQLRWDLPEGTPEGKILIQCLNRFTDARSVSPRKILVRCGMSCLAQAYVPDRITVSTVQNKDERMELLHRHYPVRIRKEAGEKPFQLDDALSLPESAPKLDKMIYCSLEPKVSESRVLADKLVFRGNMKLHVLYCSPEGQMHGWDFSMPFSQYALLDETYGSDAQCSVVFSITGLEPEADENGTLRVKCGVVCQYLITDREMLDVVEDAYSLGWDTELQREAPELNVILDRKKETLYPEQTLNVEANIAADVRFLPDFPKLRREMDQVLVQWPGTFQVLYYAGDGSLHSGNVRWEGEQKVSLDSAAQLFSQPASPEAQAAIGSGNITVSAEYPVEQEAAADQPIPMVTGVRTTQQRKPDGNRPSLILQRTGEASLWEMAKKNGSTMEAIRRANGLQEDPVDDRMLLIPVF